MNTNTFTIQETNDEAFIFRFII